MTNPVHIERNNEVWEITLDRPKANAINAETSRALGEAFLAFQDDTTARVAIITGGGEKFFSAGWDLKSVAAGDEDSQDHGAGGFAGLTELWSLDKPVIAAVNGYAAGGGFELALAADMIVAADHAQFMLPEVTLGITADAGGMIRLPRRLPSAIASEMLLTGRRMPADEALRWGLVNQVVALNTLMATARELAGRVAACAPLALNATKAVMRSSEGKTVEEAFAHVRAGHLPAYNAVDGSIDSREGAKAFAEGRTPVWQGQ